MQQIPIAEEMIQGAVSFEVGDGWIKPWRLRFGERRLHHDSLVGIAETCAGVRLRFRTTSRVIRLDVAPEKTEGNRQFDLTIGGELIRTVEAPPGGAQAAIEGLPAGEKTAEIWLPQVHGVRLRRLVVEEGHGVSAIPDQRPRWIAYGSSITHCGAAHSPARTWPATAARRRDLNLTCLGYGGNCQLEPLVGMMIRDLPANLISLKVGINVRGSLAERTFRTALIGMARIIREKQPTTPIAVISPIVSPPHESAPAWEGGLTLRRMREELEDAVARMRDYGDDNVHYFSGLDLLGEDLADRHLADGVHPDGDGYEIMGRNFAERIFPRVSLGDR